MPELPDWMRANVILGTDGTVYRAVLLGEDGSMYSVLQGEYEGALRTVKLDDEGRMSAFVIDSTDAWGRMLSIGNAELAARLGSILSYDRQGSIVQQTDFSDGWGSWRQSLLGGALLALTPGIGRMGGYAAKMTGGAVGTGKCTLLSYIPVLASDRVGLAAFLSVPIQTEYLQLEISYSDAVTRYQGWVRWDCAAEEIQILDDTPAWVPVMEDVDIYRHAQSFTFFKLVIDFTAGTYERVFFGPFEEDLTGYSLNPLAPVAYPSIYAAVRNEPRGGTTDTAYCDGIIVTVAEPDL